ncbi:hypothetical protein ACSVC9_12905 [Clostridium sp. LBM24168]
MIFSFQSHKKYIAQVVNAVDFKQVYKYFSEFPVIVNFRPFKYAVENDMMNIINSGTAVMNSGTVESEPIMNSVIQDCYDDGGNNLNEKMAGEFPRLKPWENIIEWSGDIVKAELLPNWRWL